jgi:hypothetical protein
MPGHGIVVAVSMTRRNRIGRLSEDSRPRAADAWYSHYVAS